ncbi:hypothetical protein M409DRAFT_23603 [Zasmidium cellare ATCC 36951]|uniref:Major facilitator superfamily (MFS) profile domain-containing protein n=1 Tax=Zasmidium cellare ATCC 36951 TaxID=1080233 RepID=A0A6A6CFM7_ZASCE|nr:uncharacterized protein M409DRAFT_23603 [Zasmidium cellare ATCC 36951]KAF2165871.1 hypothetical protein M409DRAFT_23603 [Zasmidium cellare ATCC 36951]
MASLFNFNPLFKAKGKLLNILITIASTCGFILFGYDNALFSGLIICPWFLRTFHNPNANLLGTISATYKLGGFAGAVIAFFIGQPLGRRKTVLTGIAITAIGAIPFAAATNIAQLTAGRTVCGVGVGIMSSTLLCGATLGLFLAQWINYGFYDVETRVAYAFPVAFQAVFLLTSTVLILGLPESPRWLAKQDRTEEALEVLTRLAGEEKARERLASIMEVNELEKDTHRSKFQALFTNGPTQNFRRLCLACGVMTMHQLTGVNSVTYYLPRLVTEILGASRKEALWISGLSSVETPIANLISLLTVDKVGRKPYLFWRSVGQGAAFMVVAALLRDHTRWGWTQGLWNCHDRDVVPVLLDECAVLVGTVMGVLKCSLSKFFMMVKITPVAIANIYYKFYIILAVFNVCSAVVIWFFYPETARLSLEEMDLMFAQKYGNVEVDKIEKIQLEHVERAHVQTDGK